MEKDVPMISGDDYNAILEESSLQEATDEVIQDTNELTHETASVIEETIDVINSTEEIEAAENAGLLSAIAVKAYSNRVNSYLDKLESRYIITKDDKLKPGLQFDNPQAGLLSVSETLKNAVRKVIEWISKAFDYLFGFTDLIQNKISQFISSRAGISKKLREKLNSLKDADYVFIDTKAYEDVLKSRALEFQYALIGKMSDVELKGEEKETSLIISASIFLKKLGVSEVLNAYADILEDKVKSRIPSIAGEGDDIVIRELGSKNRIEQLFLNEQFKVFSRFFEQRFNVDENSNLKTVNTDLIKDMEFKPSFTSSSDRGAIEIKNTRAIIEKKRITILPYTEKGLSLIGYIPLIIHYSKDAKNALEHLSLNVEKDKNPTLFIEDLKLLVKIVDDATGTLKTMAKDSKDKANAIKGWAKKNTEELKKLYEANNKKEAADDSAIFNTELKNRLAINANMVNYFPKIVSLMMSSLSSAIDDGVKLIAASTVQAVEKAKRSSTGSSEDGEYLLLAVPERYNEIIDVEVID